MSKRDDIVNAAIKEFGEFSYDTASINRIIKASGTSKGTFYHYFEDKKALYFSIIEYSLQMKKAHFARIMQSITQDGYSFFDVMKDQAKVAAVFMLENPELYQFGAQFVKEQSTIKQEFQEKYMPGLNQSFAAIVDAGLANEHFPERYPIDFMRRIISYAMLNYYDLLFDKAETPLPEEVSYRLDMLFDFLKRGFS